MRRRSKVRVRRQPESQLGGIALHQRLMDVTQLQRDTANAFFGRPLPLCSSTTRRQRAVLRSPALKLAHRGIGRSHRLEAQAIAVTGQEIETRWDVPQLSAVTEACLRCRAGRRHHGRIAAISTCLAPLLTPSLTPLHPATLRR